MPIFFSSDPNTHSKIQLVQKLRPLVGLSDTQIYVYSNMSVGAILLLYYFSGIIVIGFL